MNHAEKIKTKYLLSYMHDFSLCPSVNWSLAGLQSQSINVIIVIVIIIITIIIFITTRFHRFNMK